MISENEREVLVSQIARVISTEGVENLSPMILVPLLAQCGGDLPSIIEEAFRCAGEDFDADLKAFLEQMATLFAHAVGAIPVGAFGMHTLPMGQRQPEAPAFVSPTPYSDDERAKPQVVCFTGKLESTTREEAALQAKDMGMTVVDSVTKKTTLLVAGPGAGSKLDKAEELGIEVIDEDGWSDLVADSDIARPSGEDRRIQSALRFEEGEDVPFDAPVSCTGGVPDLPEGVAWPVGANGTPLRYIARIDLSEIPECRSAIRSMICRVESANRRIRSTCCIGIKIGDAEK